jgi:hypothetical protein
MYISPFFSLIEIEAIQSREIPKDKGETILPVAGETEEVLAFLFIHSFHEPC